MKTTKRNKEFLVHIIFITIDVFCIVSFLSSLSNSDSIIKAFFNFMAICFFMWCLYDNSKEIIRLTETKTLGSK